MLGQQTAHKRTQLRLEKVQDLHRMARTRNSLQLSINRIKRAWSSVKLFTTPRGAHYCGLIRLNSPSFPGELRVKSLPHRILKILSKCLQADPEL